MTSQDLSQRINLKGQIGVIKFLVQSFYFVWFKLLSLSLK